MSVFRSHETIAAERFSFEERLDRACMRVAFCMHSFWQEIGSCDPRMIDPALIADELIYVGHSTRGMECRQYAIPRRALAQQCKELFNAGQSTEQVAQFLKRHLALVRVSKKEHVQLSSDIELGLGQWMPDGWQFDVDDVLARIHLAKIELVLNDNYRRLSEYYRRQP